MVTESSGTRCIHCGGTAYKIRDGYYGDTPIKVKDGFPPLSNVYWKEYECSNCKKKMTIVQRN